MVSKLSKIVILSGILSAKALFSQDYNFDLTIRSTLDGMIPANNGHVKVYNNTADFGPYVSDYDGNGMASWKITGIEEEAGSNSPTKSNYTKTNINFDLGSDIKDFEFKVFDVAGKQVPSNKYEFNLNGNRISVKPNFASGVYFYGLFPKNGKNPFVVKSSLVDGEIRGLKKYNFETPAIKSSEKIKDNKGMDEWMIISTPYATGNFLPDTTYVYKDPNSLEDTEVWQFQVPPVPNVRVLEGTFFDGVSGEPVPNVNWSLEVGTDHTDLVTIANGVGNGFGEYLANVNLDHIPEDKKLFLKSWKDGYENSMEVESGTQFEAQINRIPKSSYPEVTQYDDDENVDGQNRFRWKFNSSVNIDSLNSFLNYAVDSTFVDFAKVPSLDELTFTDVDGRTITKESIETQQVDYGFTDFVWNVRQAFATKGGYLNTPENTGKKVDIHFSDEFPEDQKQNGRDFLSKYVKMHTGNTSLDYTHWFNELDTPNDECIEFTRGPPQEMLDPEKDSQMLREGYIGNNLLDSGTIRFYLLPGNEDTAYHEFWRMTSSNLPSGIRYSVMQSSGGTPSDADIGEAQLNTAMDRPDVYFHNNANKGETFTDPFGIYQQLKDGD